MSDASAPYLPLSVPVIAGNEWAYVKECLDTGWVSSAGSYVTAFEEKMREITGARFAIACQSGTAGLHVALLLNGVGAGDAVICPTVTFIATCNAIAYSGARPVFMDCDDWMNLDAEKVAAYLDECVRDSDGALRDVETGLRVAAIMPVHVFGNPCDMVALMALAERYGLVVIEDAAESLGTRWTDGPLAGRHTGTIGAMGAISFNGNKVVTAGGGGCIITDDEVLATRAKHLTTTAKTDAVRFVHDEVGYNYRLTNLAAALGTAQLEQLDGFIATKRANHAHYRRELSGIPGVTLVGVPAGCDPNWWFYTLLIEPTEAGADREAVMAHLQSRGIETRPLWYLNHRQAPYVNDRAYQIDRANWFFERALNVPCSSDLTAQDVARVATAIREACPGRNA